MTVSIRCSCGKLLDVDEQFRGQPVQCPHCQNVLTVPTVMAASSPVNKQEDDKARKERELENVRAQFWGCICGVVVGVVLVANGVALGKYLSMAAGLAGVRAWSLLRKIG